MGEYIPTVVAVGQSRSNEGGRFPVTIQHCAQNCAHPIAAKHGSRFAELVVGSRLIEKATVFKAPASKNRGEESDDEA